MWWSCSADTPSGSRPAMYVLFPAQLFLPRSFADVNAPYSHHPENQGALTYESARVEVLSFFAEYALDSEKNGGK